MKRTIVALTTAVLLVTVGVGAARAAGGDKDVDHDNPWVRALAAQYSAQATHGTPIGAYGLRMWGDNRYETAVAISEQSWQPEDAIVVFLATGLNYPDALAGAASTFGGGPVLLVEPNSLPAITAGELDRLNPCFVVAFGGPNAISDAVVNQALTYVTSDRGACDTLPSG